MAHRWFCIFLFSVFLLAVQPVLASGFMLREQSASGLGNAFAGSTTGAHDLSDIFFNPACIFRHTEWDANLSYSALNIHSTFSPQTATNFLGAAIPGNTAGGDIAPEANIPSFYASTAMHRGQKFAFAVNAPWGLESNNPAGWVGRYHALHSKVTSLNITSIWGKKFGEHTVGAVGWQRQKLEASIDNAIDFGAIGAAAKIPGAVPGTMDGYARVSGENWGNGFVLGFLHEFDNNNSLGLSYRSQVRHTLHGNAEFGLDAVGIGKALSAATKGFVNTGDSADITTPTVFSFGYQHRFCPKWVALFDASRTGWGSFKELRVKFDNPGQSDSVTNENWHDTWFYSLGFQYKPRQDLTWKIGAAVDQGPVDDEFRVPRVPTANNRWLTVGVTWEASRDTSLDLSFAHIRFSDAPIRLSAKDTGNTFRGNLVGSFDTSANIVGFSIQSKFP